MPCCSAELVLSGTIVIISKDVKICNIRPEVKKDHRQPFPAVGPDQLLTVLTTLTDVNCKTPTAIGTLTDVLRLFLICVIWSHFLIVFLGNVGSLGS